MCNSDYLYVCISLLTVQIEPDKKHKVLVVSPLKSLMKDQCSRLKKAGIACAAMLGREDMLQEHSIGW